MFIGLLLGSLIYILMGITFLLMIRGYENMMPPSRLVRLESGRYRIKELIPMPIWLWYIVLTIIWLPYTIFYIVTILNELKL